MSVKHMFGVAAAAAVILASIAAPACSLRGGTTKVSIPADYPTADRRYTLLYSTLGYESAATKRVLIRQNDTAAAVSEALAFTWFVVDSAGSRVAAGHATYAGTAWSIPLWAADFSQVTKAGEYRMLVEAPDVHLATDAFPIDQFVMFRTTYDGIALENTEARAAPVEFDNGYFAGNDRSGSVTDHAGLLVGLLESFARRGSSLNDDERARTRAAIDRAVDYLLLLSDPESGEIGQSKTRSYGDSKPVTTAAGLRGLSHFAALAQNDEPGKSDRAFRRAKLAEALARRERARRSTRRRCGPRWTTTCIAWAATRRRSTARRRRCATQSARTICVPWTGGATTRSRTSRRCTGCGATCRHTRTADSGSRPRRRPAHRIGT